MKKQILISGASIAGLTLAYWLNRYDYKVTIVEITKWLRRGGSPIDVRGDALEVAKEIDILEKIKAKEFLHTDEIVNAKNETLVTFELNSQAEYLGDIEIHRDDLVDILYDSIPANEVEFLFENRIEKIVQHEDKVEITLKDGESRNFDFVFGADGTHSSVRKLVFGNEENYSKFFGEYFAIVEAPNMKPNKPIHMDTWSKGRVALVGDAAHAANFHTGMGTSLAMQGATILAKALFSSGGDYRVAFAKYYETYKPYSESIQERIHRGINLLVPETQEGIDEAYKRFKK